MMSATKNEIIQNLNKEKQRQSKKLMLLLESISNLKTKENKREDCHTEF